MLVTIDNKYAKNYEFDDTSPQEFFNEVLERPVPTRNKTTMPLFHFYVPMKVKPIETDKEGNIKRTNGNLIGFECLILDYDGGKTIEEVETWFSDLEYYLYTSYGHDPDEGSIKFRVVLPLKNPMSFHQVRTYKRKFLILFPGVDKTTLDCGRFFYAPVVHPVRANKYYFKHNQGKLFIPPFKTPVQEDKMIDQEVKLAFKRFLLNKHGGKLNRVLKKASQDLELIKDEEGTRYYNFRRIIYRMFMAGLPDDMIEKVLEKETPPCCQKTVMSLFEATKKKFL